MTLSPLDKVLAACRKINLTVKLIEDSEPRLFLYRPDGALLRSFDIHGEAINANDFANWWRFMGFDNENRN